jgi:hypothetical protein
LRVWSDVFCRLVAAFFEQIERHQMHDLYIAGLTKTVSYIMLSFSLWPTVVYKFNFFYYP